MAKGRFVFEGSENDLTPEVIKTIYGVAVDRQTGKPKAEVVQMDEHRALAAG
jgi:ABC-type cobalamin/Fe3+-siderophores transport system ATPase subunit